MITNHPGYKGGFTRETAPGAIASGTRVARQNSEKGDATPDGFLGTVLGSVSHPTMGRAYFVEWDIHPKIAIGVIEKKVRKI